MRKHMSIFEKLGIQAHEAFEQGRPDVARLCCKKKSDYVTSVLPRRLVPMANFLFTVGLRKDTSQIGNLTWVSNLHESDYDNFARNCIFITYYGFPKPTDTYSVSELRNMGMIGVYTSDENNPNYRPDVRSGSWNDLTEQMQENTEKLQRMSNWDREKDELLEWEAQYDSLAEV